MKTLKIFYQIDLNAAFHNGDIVWTYVCITCNSFHLLLPDQGFESIRQINETPITTNQLVHAKSKVSRDDFQSILTVGCSSNKLSQLKLLETFYEKMELNFPSKKKKLDFKIAQIISIKNRKQPLNTYPKLREQGAWLICEKFLGEGECERVE